jgi:preprotein translocase subunit SecG
MLTDWRSLTESNNDEITNRRSQSTAALMVFFFLTILTKRKAFFYDNQNNNQQPSLPLIFAFSFDDSICHHFLYFPSHFSLSPPLMSLFRFSWILTTPCFYFSLFLFFAIKNNNNNTQTEWFPMTHL